jgi:chemotaxis protein MotB
MARKKKAPESAPGAPLYMATYGDMVTLILCFFVLLFAMSSIDAQKFQKALLSLKGTFGILKGAPTTEPAPQNDPAGEPEPYAGASPRMELDTQSVAYTIESYLRTEGLDKSIRVTVNQRGVSVSISDQFLFDSGSAELKPGGQRALYKIATLVRDRVPAISVEGHTDAVPLRGGRYRDNWGLSAARAAVVASYLQTDADVNPQKLQAVGFGPYRPVVPNDTSEHGALNRRVDLVFLSQYPK